MEMMMTTTMLQHWYVTKSDDLFRPIDVDVDAVVFVVRTYHTPTTQRLMTVVVDEETENTEDENG
jgi:hypothetical protein